MISEHAKLHCASCGSHNVVTEMVTQTFPYGSGNERAMLTAEVPVRVCRDCQEEFTDSEADRIIHEAVCKHLGVMAPREIVALREELGYTQQQLAELTGIGVASIARWENGYNIQNAAYDKLLRLTRFAENRRRLSAGTSLPDPPAPVRVAEQPKNKFRALSTDTVNAERDQASQFVPMLQTERVLH